MKTFFCILITLLITLDAAAGKFPRHHSKACKHAKLTHYKEPKHYAIGHSYNR